MNSRPALGHVVVSAAILASLLTSIGTGEGAEVAAATQSADPGLPLPPARVVRFRTTEGSWVSLDVSPDGREIVFDLLGHLYTLPITGGKARQLTSGLAFNRQPRYSPDGRQLVFVTDRSGDANVWIMDVHGGQAYQLSRLHGPVQGGVMSPVWSPDGRMILVSQKLGATRPGPASLEQLTRWLLASYDVKTGAMRWISDTAPDRVRSLAGPVSDPSGGAVFAAAGAPVPGIIDLEPWEIVRVDLASGDITSAIGYAFTRSGVRPALSRDGRFLAYVTSSGSHRGLRLRDLRTDRERWLIREELDDPPLIANPGDLAPGYAFTPDAKAIIAAYGGKLHRIDVATGRAVVIQFEAEVDRALGPLTVHQFGLPDTAENTRVVLQPTLSPDGKAVAFSALDRIWIMELPHDGRQAGRPRRLTTDSWAEFYPSWSRDGQWIAYSTWADGVGGTIRRAPAVIASASRPGASELLIRDTALFFHTAVSADGERVAAVRAPLPVGRLHGSLNPAVGHLELIWVPTRGGPPRTITSLDSVQHSPFHEWYPTDQLYFTDDPNRIHIGLASWRWDGTGRRSLLVESTRWTPEVPWLSAEVAGVLSFDGRRALLTQGCTLFEVALPAEDSPKDDTLDTLDLDRIQTQPLGASQGSARRWGTALTPWISWSRSGRRVLFQQGRTLFLGEVRAAGWTTFTSIEIPLPVPVDIPRGTLVLHGARLITMRGHEVIERGDLLVRDNRIAAVGPVGQFTVPLGAEVLDVTGKTILPGYVDLHDHLWLPKGVHNQQCWQCLATLAYGVTSARDPQPSKASDIFVYQERERSGELIAPRLFSTGMAYFGSGPPIRTLGDARDAVRPNAKYYRSETFKVYTDLDAGRRAWELLSMASAEAGLNATLHSEGLGFALSAVIDGFSGLEHAPDATIYDDAATLLARSGTTVTHTYAQMVLGSGWNYLSHRYGDPWSSAKMRRFVPPSERPFAGAGIPNAPELDNILPRVAGAARMVEEGGRVGIGSHGNFPGLGYHYEMWLHALGGMPSHEILRSATIVGATAIGHRRDLGSLETGKLADLQILEANPLEDIRNSTSIHEVMKNGRIYRGDDLTEVWPRDRRVPSFYLWE